MGDELNIIEGERIPRRPLPYFDEQDDETSWITGVLSSGGPFKVAFLDTNQFGPHAMVLMLVGFASVTGICLFILSRLFS